MQKRTAELDPKICSEGQFMHNLARFWIFVPQSTIDARSLWQNKTWRMFFMDASVHRRVTVAVCWALARRAALDGLERFEDSFALTEEFREWFVSLETHPELIRDTVLMVPTKFRSERPETDGLLEI